MVHKGILRASDFAAVELALEVNPPLPRCHIHGRPDKECLGKLLHAWQDNLGASRSIIVSSGHGICLLLMLDLASVATENFLV